jgi:protein-tyrosine phosphatase
VAESFEVLVVCTANVCRSPLAAAIISMTFAAAARDGAVADHLVSVRSAGTEADPGDPMCWQSAEILQASAQEHRATLLEPDLLAGADLVITADRSQRGACARLWPECRPRLFTFTQAAALATSVSETLTSGTIPDGAPPLPVGQRDRLGWLMSEMDAARGSLAGMPEGYEDIEDGHGTTDHQGALTAVEAAASALARALLNVVTSRPDGP